MHPSADPLAHGDLPLRLRFHPQKAGDFSATISLRALDAMGGSMGSADIIVRGTGTPKREPPDQHDGKQSDAAFVISTPNTEPESVRRNATAQALTAAVGAGAGGFAGSVPGAAVAAAAALRYESQLKKATEGGDVFPAIDESLDLDPTDATTERSYEPGAAQAIKLSQDHYRLWGFTTASAEPPNAFAPMLDDIAILLSIDPAARVVITGHTSMSGSDAFNEALGEQRAYRILEQFVERGVSPDRISAIGAGKSEPLVDEKAGPAAMARNRRVEIQLELTPAALTPSAPPAAPTTSPSLACDDVNHILRQNRAELAAWAAVLRKNPGAGKRMPGMSGEDIYLQPDVLDARQAAGEYGFSTAEADEMRARWKVRVDYDLLAHMNDLEVQNQALEKQLQNGECSTTGSVLEHLDQYKRP
jgi:outer membrane protein OmpA-like peptidoglycan-associated protein